MTIELLKIKYFEETGKQWYEFINGIRKATDEYVNWLENIAINVYSTYIDIIDDGK